MPLETSDDKYVDVKQRLQHIPSDPKAAIPYLLNLRTIARKSGLHVREINNYIAWYRERVDEEISALQATPENLPILEELLHYLHEVEAIRGTPKKPGIEKRARHRKAVYDTPLETLTATVQVEAPTTLGETQTYSWSELLSIPRYQEVFPESTIAGRINEAQLPRNADRRISKESAEGYVEFMQGRMYTADTINMLVEAGIKNPRVRVIEISGRLNVGGGEKGVYVFEREAVKEYIAGRKRGEIVSERGTDSEEEETRTYSLTELLKVPRYQEVFPKGRATGRISEAVLPRTTDKRISKKAAEDFVEFMQGKVYTAEAINMLAEAGIESGSERVTEIRGRLNIGRGGKRGIYVFDRKAVEDYIARRGLSETPAQTTESQYLSLTELVRAPEYIGVFPAPRTAEKISTVHLPRTTDGRISKKDAESFARFMQGKMYSGDAARWLYIRRVSGASKKVAELKSRQNIGKSETSAVYVVDKKEVEKTIAIETTRQAMGLDAMEYEGPKEKGRPNIFKLVDCKKVIFTHRGLAELLYEDPEDVEKILRRFANLGHKNGEYLVSFEQAVYIQKNSDYSSHINGFEPRLVAFNDVMRKVKERVGFRWGPLTTYAFARNFARNCGIRPVGIDGNGQKVLIEDEAVVLLKALMGHHKGREEKARKKREGKKDVV